LHIFIAYFRMSTERQGKSGLGLAAQHRKISDFAGTLIAEFCDVQSGKGDSRVELQRAIQLAKRESAKIVIARHGHGGLFCIHCHPEVHHALGGRSNELVSIEFVMVLSIGPSLPLLQIDLAMISLSIKYAKIAPIIHGSSGRRRDDSFMQNITRPDSRGRACRAGLRV
jgi:GMP synthase-like glutamine amidotransferase